MSLIGNPPAVIFLDEPTTGLDPRRDSRSGDAVTRLASGGTTVLLTTQHLDEAEQLADRIAILHKGTIIQSTAPSPSSSSCCRPQRSSTSRSSPRLEDVFLALVGEPCRARMQIAERPRKRDGATRKERR